MKKTLLKLHPKQSEIFLDDSVYRIVVAGRKFGKSTLALAELLRAVKTMRNVVYIAPTYKMAKNTLWLDHIRKFIPLELTKDRNETDLRLVFPNGNMITLYGADDPDRLRGLNINFAVLDEFADIKSSAWQQIIEPNLLTTKGKALFIGTPKGKKNHLYSLYNMASTDPIYKSWHFTSYDNPLNDKNKLDSTKERLTNQGKDNWWKQEYLALFTVLAGMVYDNWDRDIHIIEPEITDCSYGFAIDRGTYAPSSVGLYKIYRKEGEDRIHRYDEIYRSGLTPKELLAEIKNRMGTDREFIYQFCDPSATDFMATANEEQFINIEPAPRETGGKEMSWVREGISVCKEWLAKSPTDGKPRFTVSPKCKNFIEEIEGYIWEEGYENEEYKDRPRKLNDHAMDEWRYFINSFAKGPNLKSAEDYHFPEDKHLKGRFY